MTERDIIEIEARPRVAYYADEPVLRWASWEHLLLLAMLVALAWILISLFVRAI